MRIRKTDRREELWTRLKDATGENTVSGALDAAAAHFLSDRRNKERVVEELPDELVDELSTVYLPLEREVTHTVGKDD
jgi:hypothetical protein